MDSLKKSLWLLCFALLVCCILYPLALWTIGQLFFPFQANGSLLYDASGKLIGSQLIAQDFADDGLFHPRPSAASFDASASASSSLAASNPALRDRVAQALGPLAAYRDGRPVGPDIDSWFQREPQVVAAWATRYPDLAKQLHPDDSAAFYQTYSQEHPGTFPSAKTNGPISSGPEIHSLFFDMWRQENPDLALKALPADGFTTSASGLDPHITLQNALYQLERIAATWSTRLERDPATVRGEIEKLLEEKKFAPWSGLLGEPLVNVLELNLALRQHFKS